MTRRLAGIALIFLGASIAWLILGATLAARTSDSDETARGKLDGQWGSAQTQPAPSIVARVPRETYNAAKKRLERTIEDVALPVERSDIRVAINMQQRRKGLLWYSLYDIGFAAMYTVRNTSPSDDVEVQFNFPAAHGNFTDVRFEVNGKPVHAPAASDGIHFNLRVPPGRTTRIDGAYASRGAASWSYRFSEGLSTVRDFHLALKTNFDGYDFPPGTLLPTGERKLPDGWNLAWNYGSIVTSNGIGITIPEHLQPGPLAQRITFWAPVSLLFYFFVIVVIVTLRGVELHPYNYFFLACAFFAFHLLFAYLVDRIAIEWAFAICSAVSLFLTISYLRLVAGLRFAAVESGLAQLIYLVLFSFALFNEGWSGLSITIGAILTLFVVMQLTGRIRWSVMAAPKPLPDAPV